MTNEQIVSEIRNGYSVTDYMQLLYESNLPLIKKFIKAKRELLEKLDIVEAGAYRNSINKFNEHGFTSTEEYIALRRAELQAEYEKHKGQVEIMLEQRKRKCL